jgi:hypothetical protein
MQQIFLYGTTIILGALLFGLLLYSFYIVLTSKDENYKKQTGKDSTEIINGTVSLEKHPAIPDKTKILKPTNQPPQKTPGGKKGTRRAA